MTQSVQNIDPSNPGGDTGTTLAAKINQLIASFLSMNGGSSRPSYAVAGMAWLDTNTSPWVLKIYDGTQDVSLMDISPSTHLITKVYGSAALLALQAVTPASNKLPYFDGASSAALADLTSVARDFLAATTVQAQLNALRQGAVTLTDGTNVSVNAAGGKTFRLSAAGNRNILAPSGGTDAQEIIIEHTASGASRTPSFASGAGGYAFSSTDTVTATDSGKTDVYGFKYRSSVDRWWCLGIKKGLGT